MTVLFEYLAALEKQLGTVVHIGAGSGAVLECYAALKPARVVLLEGDADTAAELLRAAAQCPWAEVLAHPVSTTGSPLEWHRYNLCRLNGPLQSGALHSFYPRLRLVESRTVNARALTDVLAAVQVATEAGGINVLVLDVPGQEAALLDSLPHGELIKFDAVLLRGSREALPAWGTTAEQAVNQLQRACFDTAAAEFDQEPLWPVTLLRFNAQRHQTEVLEQRLSWQLAALEAADERLKALQAHFDAVSQAKAAADQTAADRAGQIERLNQGKAQAEQTAHDRGVQIEQLTRSRDEQAALAAERQTQLQALTQAYEERGRQHDNATSATESLHKANAKLKAETEALHGANAQLVKKAEDLETAHAGMLQKVADADRRRRLLDNEILKAEAQLELIKDVLIREKNF